MVISFLKVLFWLDTANPNKDIRIKCCSIYHIYLIRSKYPTLFFSFVLYIYEVPRDLFTQKKKKEKEEGTKHRVNVDKYLYDGYMVDDRGNVAPTKI